MNTATTADTAIRILSPEMAADKLGWTLARVLQRRDELGLGPFVARRVKPRPENKAITSKSAEPKPANDLAAVGA